MASPSTAQPGANEGGGAYPIRSPPSMRPLSRHGKLLSNDPECRLGLGPLKGTKAQSAREVSVLRRLV